MSLCPWAWEAEGRLFGDTPLNPVAQAQMLFGIPQRVGFSLDDSEGLLMTLTAPSSEVTVALMGGHVQTWTRFRGEAPGPTDAPVGDEILWLSPERPVDPAKPRRGGIPICWPWFGAHPSDPDQPAHGIARTAAFKLLGTWVDDERTHVQLALADRSSLIAPFANCEISIQLSVGPDLRLDLTTMNLGDDDVDLSQALHTYFRVDDIAEVRVEGLEGASYIDALDGWLEKQQTGPVTFSEEVDRIYTTSETPLELLDTSAGRRVRIVTSGSRSAVVWNPWIEKSKRLGDMGLEGYRQMVCIETANAGHDRIVLKPRLAHRLTAILSVEDL